MTDSCRISCLWYNVFRLYGQSGVERKFIKDCFKSPFLTLASSRVCGLPITEKESLLTRVSVGLLKQGARLTVNILSLIVAQYDRSLVFLVNF